MIKGKGSGKVWGWIIRKYFDVWLWHMAYLNTRAPLQDLQFHDLDDLKCSPALLMCNDTNLNHCIPSELKLSDSQKAFPEQSNVPNTTGMYLSSWTCTAFTLKLTPGMCLDTQKGCILPKSRSEALYVFYSL